MPALVEIRDVLAAAMALSPRNHPHVGSEHLALVAWEGPGGFAEIARDNGVDALRLASILGNCCPDRLERPVGVEPAITVRTATAVAVASQIAMADGAPSITPGHLILALLEDPGAIAWRGVRLAGLTLAQVYDGVLARRVGPPPAPGPLAAARLFRELEGPVNAWLGLSKLAAPGPDDSSAARQAVAARAYAVDLAALGGRRGLLRPPEVATICGAEPDVAFEACRLASAAGAARSTRGAPTASRPVRPAARCGRPPARRARARPAGRACRSWRRRRTSRQPARAPRGDRT